MTMGYEGAMAHDHGCMGLWVLARGLKSKGFYIIFKPRSICKGDKRGMDEEMEKGEDIWCRPSLSRTKD